MSAASKTKPPGASQHAVPRLDEFLAAVRDTNPFAANRITEPSPYDVDVPAIHAKEFDRLIALSGQALRERSAIGVALLGGAGVGKSHLLSRLYRWAHEPADGDVPRACYVYLHNILADPDRLPRYMVKYVVSRLSAGGQGVLHETPLFRFVDRAIRHALEEAGVKADSVESKLKEAGAAYRSCFGKVAEHWPAFHVLFQFWRFARPEKASEAGRRDLALAALGWLSGDEIDPAFAARLGFKVAGEQPVMLRDDHEVEQVLLVLTQLARVSGQPLVLCIDQVDNLDSDKVRALARFVHTLLDHAGNLLVVTSGVKQTLLGFRDDGTILEAAWDRIAQYAVDVNRIVRADARHILEARLERFHEPFVEVDEVRRRLQHDTLFPLGVGWLEARLGDGIEFRPRDVLSWARDAWYERQSELGHLTATQWMDHSGAGQHQGCERREPLTAAETDAAVDGVVERKLAEQVAQHRLRPGSLPPDAGNLAGLVESLLAECQGDGLPYTFQSVERVGKRGSKLPPYDLLVRERRETDGHEITTGIVFVTNVGLSATASLRRLLRDERPPDHRLLVTDDERRPLKVGAQGVEYYKDLHKLGRERFEHLKIDFEQYAALDALHNVVGMARSGDLEIESPPGTPRPVAEAEVVASHHRQDRYRRHPLLRPLLTEEPPVVTPLPPPPPLDEADVRQYVMAQLAWMMGSTASAIAKGYVGVMKGPKLPHEVAWPKIKAIAGRMHADGLLHATPQDDDLFLLLRK